MEVALREFSERRIEGIFNSKQRRPIFVVKPRELELPALLERLMNEHDEIKNLLNELSILLFENKFLTVAKRLEELKLIIDQHIIDEEAKILKFLLNTVSKEESSQAIAVFQQHREIHQLLKKLRENAQLLREESTIIRGELENIMMMHFEAEEHRIFPLVIKFYKKLL